MSITSRDVSAIKKHAAKEKAEKKRIEDFVGSWGMILFAILFCLLASLLHGCQTTHIVDTPYGPRDYGLYVPRDLPQRPVPLVVLNHFAILNNEATIHVTRFDRLAEKEKFLVATTKADGPFFFPRDLPYLESVIKDVQRQHRISKLFMVGLSNGGGLTQLAACNGFNISSIAMVGSAQLEEFNAGCESGGRPIPTLIIHGTEDPIVSYYGGSFYGIAQLIPIPEIVDYWVTRNEAMRVEVYTLPDLDKSDGTMALVQEYYGKAPVKEVTIVGGGHTYPGYDSSFLQSIGKTNLDFDATEMIWNFFNEVD